MTNLSITSFHLSVAPGLSLALHRQPPAPGVRRRGPVLYVHGATFGARLAVFHRFAGRSWADALAVAGFEVWGLDFVGYGAADRWPQQAADPTGQPPLLRAAEAAAQLVSALHHVSAISGVTALPVVAHSWGCMVAAHAAATAPGLVTRLALFGAIVPRQGGPGAPARLGAWRWVTVPEQLARFVEDLPPGHPPVLMEPDLAGWGPAWLATEPMPDSAHPAAMRVPNGPVADIAACWAGEPPYDPAAVAVPMRLLRGAWDSLCTDADAARLLARWGGPAQDVRLPAGTHLMHLEQGREALYAATNAFLTEET